MRKSQRPVRPLRLHLERAARLLLNLQNQVSVVVVTESRCPRSLLEVANRLRQARHVDECQRRHLQSLAFFAVVVAVVAVAQRWSEAARHPVLHQLGLPDVPGAAAQTSIWLTQVNRRHRRHRSLAATSIGSPGWTSARVHVYPS